MRILVLALLLASCAMPDVAVAKQRRVPVACRQALDQSLPGWSIPRPTDDEQEWSNSENLDPAVAFGDFDGDGRQDVAVLVLHEQRRKVALCLKSAQRDRIVLIAEPYCSDVISMVPARTRISDLAGVVFALRHDGLSTYCVGKAGATYVLESGKIRQIVDSD